MVGQAASPTPRIRVLLAKIGLDGHDRGVRVVARGLRDAGMEVVYVGPWAQIDTVVGAALDEDVDVIGISSLAYDHLLIPDLMAALREVGFDGIVVVGGVIQEQDIELLWDAGVTAVFGPGQRIGDIVECIRTSVSEGHGRVGI